MKYLPVISVAFALVLPLCGADYRPDIHKNLGFRIYTNAPPGKQLTGVYAPPTEPALAPEESQKKFNVPSGFEVRLFASEPEVVNPVAMTWDERGRLWVLELYEYPKGAPKGQRGRDRIKILEDTDGDGRADKVTVFADGFSLATGLALGNGGVYLGAAPDFLFLEDTNGDDKVDKTTVLKTGFGLEDRHELLNGFAWGPDGWLYLTHGVFTQSKVRDPNDPDGFGVAVNAALARYHPRTKKFEVFADGTSNPWGVDWNERGDAFVSACVIHHLFHMAPGGQYHRQGGTWANPYGYVSDLPSKGLPAIVDWRHFRAAHAGICIYQGDQWPAEWRGLVFLGNIHESAINCDRLTPVGSTYRAERETKLLGPPKGQYQVGGGTFLASDDHWFRPVSCQTGPDGALWIMDWCDKYPCYQNANADPEGVDRELGRIWRVVWVGDHPGKPVPSRTDPNMDLEQRSRSQLAKLLEHANSWQRRQAQRLLTERLSTEDEKTIRILAGLAGLRLYTNGQTFADATHLSALGVLHATGNLSSLAASSGNGVVVDAWSARFAGESAQEVIGEVGKQVSTPEERRTLKGLEQLAKSMEPTTRAAVAVALRQLTTGSLTVDTKPAMTIATSALMPHFVELLARSSVEGDCYYPHIVWMAMEPRVAADPQPFFPLLAANENSVSAYCLQRTMRRICDLADATTRAKQLNAAMEFLGTIADKSGLTGAALDGLIESQKAKGAPPTVPLEPIFAKLTANSAIADKARHLATLFGNTTASFALIAKINDRTASAEDRLQGIQAARETKTDSARDELLKLVRTETNQSLLTESIRSLEDFNDDRIAHDIVGAWNNFNITTRRAAADVLVTRARWERVLLGGVDAKIVSPRDISATARRALARSTDRTLAEHANQMLGRYRATGQDKLKLIAEKRKVVLSGPPDLTAGSEVAKRTCLVCHKLYGEGADVGPDLTGVGRSTLDALLHNIIDPNEVIGNGFENTEVELKDGRTLNGRIVEDTDQRLTLLSSGPTEHVIARSDLAVVDGKPAIRTSELSLMPEALEQMPDADFRNLIWYLLNPPQDHRPWTPALRKELIGE